MSFYKQIMVAIPWCIFNKKHIKYEMHSQKNYLNVLSTYNGLQNTFMVAVSKNWTKICNNLQLHIKCDVQ